MPEKSLPFYRSSQQKQSNPQEQPSNQAIFNIGTNLVFQDETLPANFQSMVFLTGLFKKLIFLTIVVFGLMLMANVYLNLKLESQRLVINQLADQVGTFTLTEKQAIDIDKKINFYQATLSQRNLLGDKTKAIFSNLPDDIKLLDINLSPTKFSMNIEVGTPLEFAKLIAKYLSDPHISQISLNSADLITSRNVFRVNIGGVFK